MSYEAEIEYWKSLYRSEKQQKEDARSAWNELCTLLEDAHMANSALTDERDALKAELALQGNAQAALVSLSKQYNLVWNERNEIAAMYHQALENAQAAQSEIATMQAELSALQPAIDPDVDAEVQARWREIWAATEAPTGVCGTCYGPSSDIDCGYPGCGEELPEYAIPRMYKYFVPSCVYPARVGRRRVYQYHSRLHQHRWTGGITQRELMALARHEGLYATPRELARLRSYAADWDATAEQMLNDSIPW